MRWARNEGSHEAFVDIPSNTHRSVFYRQESSNAAFIDRTSHHEPGGE